MSDQELKPYEAADLAPDTYIGEYFQPSVKVYKKADVDEELENKNMMLEELARALGKAIQLLNRYEVPTGFKGEAIYIHLQKYQQSKVQP